MSHSHKAPNFSLTLSAMPMLSLSGKFEFTVSIQHNIDVTRNPENRHVTFKNTWITDMFDTNRYVLLQDGENGLEWIPEDESGTGGFPGFVEDIIVGEDGRFESLAPGKSITYTTRLYPDFKFVDDFQKGQKYSWQYVGGDIAWWDWGSKEVSGWRSLGATFLF